MESHETRTLDQSPESGGKRTQDFFFRFRSRFDALFVFPFSDEPKPTSHAHMAGDRPPRKRRLPRVTRQLLGDGIRKQLRHRWVRIPTRARSGRENTRSFSVVPAHECAEFKER